ncbi:hypothetical protein [Streptomyces sp. NPDC058330]|uniref:hypothetical protein n=1 Tax=Streptomyces sp. NPDC058330 TaxID=3346449 RepID=UPI0036EFC88F
MVWLTRISASTGYFIRIMVPMLLAGAGAGRLNSPLAATILADVPPKEAGGASGALQTVAVSRSYSAAADMQLEDSVEPRDSSCLSW